MSNKTAQTLNEIYALDAYCMGLQKRREMSDGAPEAA